MSVGDNWEISFAAPLANYRFTEWNPSIASGPVGWYCDSTAGFTFYIMPGNQAASLGPLCCCRFYCATSGRYLRQFLPDRSFPPYSITTKVSLRYYSDMDFYADIDWRSFGGSSQGWSLYTRTAAGWTTYTSNPEEHVGLSGARIRYYSSLYPWNLYVADTVIRWTPTDWGQGFETLGGFPNPSGLYYGPIGMGNVERFNDSTGQWFGLGSRPEKWTLRATYEDLEEADYLTLQRYWLGSRGGLDGIPHPVAIRPYLIDHVTVRGPEILVGYFAEDFGFERHGLGGTYSGELVLEEM